MINLLSIILSACVWGGGGGRGVENVLHGYDDR